MVRREGGAGMDWLIMFTHERRLCWAPMIAVMGGLREQDGCASGGQIRYSWIDLVERRGPGLRFTLELDPTCRFLEHAPAADIIEVIGNPEQMAVTAGCLAHALAAYWAERGGLTETALDDLRALDQIDWNQPGPFEISLRDDGQPVQYTPG
jgi:hypothetical protein